MESRKLTFALMLVFALACGAAFAQEGAASAPEAASTASNARGPVRPVVAVLTGTSVITEVGGSQCWPRRTKTVYPEALVVVLRRDACGHPPGGDHYSYYDVLLNGEVLHVQPESMSALLQVESGVDTGAQSSFSSDIERRLPADVIQQNLEEWKELSRALHDRAVAAFGKEVQATSHFGVAVLSYAPYDVSDYTEGTGVRFTVLGSSKKDIKYVKATIAGKNAVGDLVPLPFGRGRTFTLTGIGPLRSHESATYSKDYVWHTDIVETLTLLSIRVEFTDGTSRTLNGDAARKVVLSKRARAYFLDNEFP